MKYLKIITVISLLALCFSVYANGKSDKIDQWQMRQAQDLIGKAEFGLSYSELEWMKDNPVEDPLDLFDDGTVSISDSEIKQFSEGTMSTELHPFHGRSPINWQLVRNSPKYAEALQKAIGTRVNLLADIYKKKYSNNISPISFIEFTKRVIERSPNRYPYYKASEY